ncbi:MAG: 1,4-alpha-glucan branching protein domain-containing protein [Actinomycetota bacterium]|nr:DUF1957 domain-containing protein [Actinomycetota bacterium]
MDSFALVLHTHLPYVRRNGISPCGEDFFHEAAFESWLPLLDVLERVPPSTRLTIGVTPILANQWNDPYMLKELRLYLGRVELGALGIAANRVELDSDAFRTAAADAALRSRRALARLDSLPGGIASGYAALESAGIAQLIGGPATHPLLPMTGHSMQRAQIALGAGEHTRIFGSRPAMMWLPECAYVPGSGVEAAFAAEGIRAFVVDEHMLGHRVAQHEGLAVAALDRTLVDAVWADGGYPGDAAYREFTGREYETGIKLFRVTAHDGWATMKQPYDPVAANRRVADHAAAFVDVIEKRFAETDPGGVLVAAFDTELFGHWWLEGPAFLGHVAAMLAMHPSIRMVTLEEALSGGELPIADVEEGSWGLEGDFRSWFTSETEDMWDDVQRTEKETARFLTRHEGSVADQLLREQLLLSSSDWTFGVGLDRNAQYCRERFAMHLERWERLAAVLQEKGDDAEAAGIFATDNPFPDVSAARSVIASSLPSFDPV